MHRQVQVLTHTEKHRRQRVTVSLDRCHEPNASADFVLSSAVVAAVETDTEQTEPVGSLSSLFLLLPSRLCNNAPFETLIWTVCVWGCFVKGFASGHLRITKR